MLEAISRILGRCGSVASVLPPTELFNEGWMLRLVLDWLDRNRQVEHPLSFRAGARWYSEALLPSRFLPKTRGDSRAESFTHADGILGHFGVASGVRGDATLAITETVILAAISLSALFFFQRYEGTRRFASAARYPPTSETPANRPRGTA